MRRLCLATIMCLIGFGLVVGITSAQAALEDILFEKGQITKEEWVKAKADSEKAEQELKKQRDQEFPISVG